MIYKNKIYSVVILLAFTLISACDKNEITPLQIEVGDQARIAIVNVIPGAPNIDVLANGTKISGNPLAFSARFPIIQYSLLTPGNAVIKTVVNTPLILPLIAPNIAFGTELSSNSFNFLTNKNYTVFVTGIPGGATNGVLIEDAFPAVANLKAHVKFVNTLPDAGNMDLLTGIVPAGATNAITFAALFSNIARNAGTDFVAIDVPADGATYQFQLRLPASGLATGSLLTFNALPGRLYTVYARGFNTLYTIPGFTPARTIVAASGLSVFANR